MNRSEDTPPTRDSAHSPPDRRERFSTAKAAFRRVQEVRDNPAETTLRQVQLTCEVSIAVVAKYVRATLPGHHEETFKANTLKAILFFEFAPRFSNIHRVVHLDV